jgi:hypothetical protein
MDKSNCRDKYRVLHCVQDDDVKQATEQNRQRRRFFVVVLDSFLDERAD